MGTALKRSLTYVLDVEAEVLWVAEGGLHGVDDKVLVAHVVEAHQELHHVAGGEFWEKDNTTCNNHCCRLECVWNCSSSEKTTKCSETPPKRPPKQCLQEHV